MNIPGREELTAQVSRVLFDADPIGIAVGPNVDEYDVEAREIVARMPGVRTGEELRSLVHQVFVAFFDDGTAGPPDRYTSIADQIWALWAGSTPSYSRRRLRTSLRRRGFVHRQPREPPSAE